MTLDIISHIIAIVMAVAAAIGWVLIWRKKLLKTGFSQFRVEYKSEMDEFKSHVMNLVDTFRDIMNKNDERHTRQLDRIVELHHETRDAVKTQMNKCTLLQTSRKLSTKAEEDWKKNIKSELDQVKADVSHIKKVINHAK